MSGVHGDLPEIMDDFLTKARRLVSGYVHEHLDASSAPPTIVDIYVVWFSKTLENWKALIGTSLPDGMYYEVTYNGAKGETYLDAYKKIDHVVIPD